MTFVSGRFEWEDMISLLENFDYLSGLFMTCN